MTTSHPQLDKLVRAQKIHPLVLVPFALFAGLLIALIIKPLPWAVAWPWIPSLDIAVTLYVDGLAAQFLLIITGIGTLVYIYGSGYLAGHPRSNRVFVLLTLFMLAMVGAVLSDHLLVLFMFWELTSVFSFLLVGFDHDKEENRKSAQQAILVTGVGGLLLLAGIILLGQIAGTYSIQTILQIHAALLEDPRLPIALALLFLGTFSKSAQFPFHFWLPNAMAAPTPVSAYLHSATMVKLGIYLLARLDAAFGDLLFWEYVLVSFGTFTAVLGAIRTLYERDLKRILAWSTVATLGTLTMLVGLPGSGAALATSTLFFAHALYKAPLFFVAGNLDHGAGTRQIDQLTGMRHYMPWTAASALLASISMAGLPLTFGFVAKDAITFAKLQADAMHLVSYATVFVNGISMAVAAVAAVRIFWGCDTVPRQIHPHEANIRMLFPPLLLAAVGILFGIAPTLVDPLLGAATNAMYPVFDASMVTVSYDIFQVLEATLAAIVFGGLVYLRWDWLHAHLGRIGNVSYLSPEAWYQGLLKWLPRIAAKQTRLLQHGLLPRYLMTLVGVLTFLIFALLMTARPEWTWPAVETLSLPVTGASLLIAAGAFSAVFVRDHLVLILVSGMVGFGSAVLFLFTGAPDLAYTQFVVETVFVVVAATVLVKLRRMPIKIHRAPKEPRIRPLALAISLAFGLTLTTLVLLLSGVPLNNTLTDFYAQKSLLAANGRNVVNVILVDFRALDTLGEIAVLTFALIAAFPLLRRLKDKRS